MLHVTTVTGEANEAGSVSSVLVCRRPAGRCASDQGSVVSMSRQMVRPGGSLDIATPQEMADLIAAAFSQHQNEHYRREKGVVNLDGTGAGQDGKVVAPRLYDYVLERVTASAAAGAVISFYENQQANTDLLESVTIPASGLYSDSFSNSLFLPAGSKLLVVVSAGGANGQATYNLQIKMIRADNKPNV